MSDALDRLKAALADRYRAEREFARGGMATVYLTEDLKHHRQVAIKVVRPDLARSWVLNGSCGPSPASIRYSHLRKLSIKSGTIPWRHP